MARVAERIRFFIKLTRAVEWWEYKLTALLAVAYATALLAGIPLWEISVQLLFYITATAVSYTYVSLINDYTDIEEDLAVGKRTGMLGLPRVMRLPVLLASIGIGVVFGWLMWPDILSLVFFASTWVVFTLYSVPPFRWKARGVLGVFCDATGVHLFPSLLMVTGVFNVVGLPINQGWLVAVGVWAFAYGLRGILAHQFVDRSNDIQTNTDTFASKADPLKFRPIAVLILLIELLAFGAMLVYIAEPVLLVLFPLYLLLVGIRYRMYGQILVSIVIPKDRPWQILMDDFYQIFFPIGLLVLASANQSWAWIVLVVHVFLFHRRGLAVIKDYAVAIKSVGRKLIRSVRRFA